MKRYTNFLFIFVVVFVFLGACSLEESPDKPVYDNELIDQGLTNANVTVSNCSQKNTTRNLTEITIDMTNKFFTGDIAGFFGNMVEDVVWRDEGTLGPEFPYYGPFYGYDGILEWMIAVVTDFDFLNYEMLDFIEDGNKVIVHVRETLYVKASQSTIIKEGAQMWVYDEDNKLVYWHGISDTDATLQGVYGEAGEFYITPYQYEVFEDSHRQVWHNKKNARKIMNYLATGKSDFIKHLLTDESTLIMNGPLGKTPFNGKFVGKEEILDYASIYKDEISNQDILYVIGEDNQVVVIANIMGTASWTGNPFECTALITFQFNSKGKIASVYYKYNTYDVASAYSELSY